MAALEKSLWLDGCTVALGGTSLLLRITEGHAGPLSRPSLVTLWKQRLSSAQPGSCCPEKADIEVKFGKRTRGQHIQHPGGITAPLESPLKAWT